jgi:hypothetical protein
MPFNKPSSPPKATSPAPSGWTWTAARRRVRHRPCRSAPRRARCAGAANAERLGCIHDRPAGSAECDLFRNPRPDAVDPDSGERYRDVIVFWVADEAEKQALIQDESTPFFSTSHFDGHPSVLVQASRLSELSLAELQEIVHDAWLARASRHRGEQWLISHPASGMPSAG